MLRAIMTPRPVLYFPFFLFSSREAPIKRKRPHWLGHPPTHKSFKPYVIAIGQATIAWNGLQESLRTVFSSLMGSTDTARGNAAWYALKSDRSQRDMLRDISKEALASKRIKADFYKVAKFLVDQSSEISNVRDIAVHAPLVNRISPDVIVPASDFGNPLAMKLNNKDILTEFRWCRDVALALTDLAVGLDEFICAGQPLPAIPSLPNRGQKKSRKPHPNQPQQG